MSKEINWEYPKILAHVADVLGFDSTLDGFRKMAKAMRVQEVEAETYKIPKGRYAGCYDDEKIDAKIATEVLKQFPALILVLQHENDHYSTLCGWLDGFLEDVAYLNGDRPLPEGLPDSMMPVKRAGLTKAGDKNENHGMMHMDHCIIFSHQTHKQIAKYDNLFEMALDGWRID